VIVLVLGGTRSGKSEIAERLAADAGAPVTYVATAVVRDADTEFTERVAEHRKRRPWSWTTIESGPDLAGAIGEVHGTVLVDSRGAWVAAADDFCRDVDTLCRALRDRAGTTIVVSEEVGLSVHPTGEIGRAFVDALGDCNRAVAAIADRVLLVVAGRVLELGAP
jgi:adenosyl cobinamide kinase/adenosyl cobinamide phosphate guanylyltransferase